MSRRRLILSIWLPGARYGQNERREPYFKHFGCLAPQGNEPQESHFEHFGGLTPDMAKMSLGRFILSILVAWCLIWPE